MGTLAQRRWITKLLGYNFLVEYKKGKENVVADALSRQGEESMDVPTSDLFSVEGANLYPTKGTLFIISFPKPYFRILRLVMRRISLSKTFF